MSINESRNFYASRPEGSSENFVISVPKTDCAIPIALKVGYPKGETEPPSSHTPSPSDYTNTTITTTLAYTEGDTAVVTVTTCPPTMTGCPVRYTPQVTPQVVTTIIPVTKTTTYYPATMTTTYVPYTPYTEYTAYTSTVTSKSTVKTTAPLTEFPNGTAKAGSIAGIGMLAAAAYLF